MSLVGLLVLGGDEFDAFLFEGDAAGIEVAAAESDDVGGELAEEAEVGSGFIVSGELSYAARIELVPV